MQTIDIDGAWLLADGSSRWCCVDTLVSQDRLRLARILRDGTRYQVERYQRGDGLPQWRGAWWNVQRDHSLTDSEANARALAAQWLDGVPN
ncbi:hypothetical protein [Stenotrophomonas sp.]|uniref:hypothetical protein n=1 Tax=Stenotrophomonas sp. TaxID=69392 RepID=UPI0028A65834|nr:hypothetical protein [Stenotrophomonas sp.]HYQ22726.1 hypothetical protein [Stenotrophomonas sp.]